MVQNRCEWRCSQRLVQSITLLIIISLLGGCDQKGETPVSTTSIIAGIGCETGTQQGLLDGQSAGIQCIALDIAYENIQASALYLNVIDKSWATACAIYAPDDLGPETQYYQTCMNDFRWQGEQCYKDAFYAGWYDGAKFANCTICDIGE